MCAKEQQRKGSNCVSTALRPLREIQNTMNENKSLTRIAIITSIILFILTYAFYDDILATILPTVDRAIYQEADGEIELEILLTFCFVVALIPVFIAAAWVFSPIISSNYKFLSIVVITGCGLLAVYIRYQSIKRYLLMMTEGTRFNVTYPYEWASFEYYILGGLVAGFIICYAVFRQKQTK